MTIAGLDLFAGATSLGIGALSPAILFATMLVGPHHAVLLAVVTNAVSHLQILPQGLRDGDWKIARQVMVGNFAGSVLGGIVGTWVYRSLTVTGFFRFFQAVVPFGAVTLVWHGVTDLL